MKIFDKLLNITLFAVVAIWIAGQFIETPEERQQKIREVAAAEFGVDANAAPEKADDSATGTIILPALSAADINKEMVSAPRVVIFIFASWCPYCKKMFPEMARAAAEFGSNIRVVGFSIDEDKAALEAYLQGQDKIGFPIHVFSTPEEHETLKETLREKDIDFSGGIPYLVIIDHGYIEYQQPGLQTLEELRLILPHKGDTKPAPDNNI